MALTLAKVLYVLARDLDIFSLPGLRGLRDRIYAWHLGAHGIVVDSRVRIQPLHANPDRRTSIGVALHVGADALIDLSGQVAIGDHVTVSEGAKIMTHDHNIHAGGIDWRSAGEKFSTIEIGDHAWIGASAIVTPSVRRIGRGAVIGAGSVVTKDVPDMAVMVGVPARQVGLRA